MEQHDFAWALRQALAEKKIMRSGWNGKGIFVAAHIPSGGVQDWLNTPYLYIDTTGLQSNNPDVHKGRWSWVPSMQDLFADDWEILE
ncbi:MAG: DUF2829 domain-containing protein [Neisseriaceae bacterium]|nr:DUF2829 domain-containing protein [Neisseriaceae bacterium]